MPLKSRKKSLVNVLHFIRNRREGLPRPHQNRWGSITQLEIPIHGLSTRDREVRVIEARGASRVTPLAATVTRRERT